MKKLLTIFFTFAVVLVSGIMLTACGEKDFYNISFSDSISNLLEIKVFNGQEEMTARNDGTYEVKNDANVTVKLYAKEVGVDFSEMVVKSNDREKQFFENREYDALTGEDLYFGWFTLPMLSVKSDVKLDISGVKKIKSKFTFEGVNLDNESNIEKLRTAKINIKGNEYLNFYDFLSGSGNKTYEREFDGQTLTSSYCTFNMKFEFDEKEVLGVYDLVNFLPFKIKTADGQERGIRQCRILGDHYVVDLGNLGEEKEYTILVDFSNLPFKEFNIIKPDDCDAYTIELDRETTNFNSKNFFTIAFNPELVDVEKVVVKLNGDETVLEAVVEDPTQENVLKFKIPLHLTPNSINGKNEYEITIEGVDLEPSPELPPETTEV